MRYLAFVLVFVLSCSPVQARSPLFPLPWDKCWASREVEHPAVVRVHLGSGGLCSGVVVGRREVLTAAHCVEDETALSVELVNGLTFPAERAVASGPAGEDVALVFLGPRFRPLAIAAVGVKPPAPGAILQIVGYGCDGDDHERQLMRRARARVPNMSRVDAGLELDGCACPGDSGSPLFNSSGEVEAIAYAISKGTVYATDASVLGYLRAAPVQ